ncbi:hypothetical protein P3S68_029721 [Capsicum galapagoense]
MILDTLNVYPKSGFILQGFVSIYLLSINGDRQLQNERADLVHLFEEANKSKQASS